MCPKYPPHPYPPLFPLYIPLQNRSQPFQSQKPLYSHYSKTQNKKTMNPSEASGSHTKRSARLLAMAAVAGEKQKKRLEHKEERKQIREEQRQRLETRVIQLYKEIGDVVEQSTGVSSDYSYSCFAKDLLVKVLTNASVMFNRLADVAIGQADETSYYNLEDFPGPEKRIWNHPDVQETHHKFSYALYQAAECNSNNSYERFGEPEGSDFLE